MKKYIVILFATLFLFSCKSEFEKVRMSNDPSLVYKTALKYYDAGNYGKAQTLLEVSIPNYRGKTEAEDLFYKYAYTHYYQGEYILASHYFDRFSNTFFNSKNREDAVYMSAYSNYMMSPKSSLDQTYTQEAMQDFEAFINAYPRSEKVEEANNLIDEMREKLDKKAYEQGALYYKIGSYQAALHSYETLLKDFPDSKRAEKVRYMMVKTAYEYATRSIYIKKKERFEQTVNLYNRFMKKYKNSKYNDELKSIYNKSLDQIKNLK